MHLRIGTRGSALALWQAETIMNMIQKKDPSLKVELVKIKTKGDKILDAPLAKIGDKGLFTKELDHALLNGDIDLAVHSMKDVPTQLPEGLVISAVPLRGVVEDVFVSNKYDSLEEIPGGGVIATGSLRRKSQLLAYRPDLTIVDIRGNVNTRLAKLDASNWDGMILARAGLERLNMKERIKEIIPVDFMLPAVGQGALAVVTRKDDQELIRFLQSNIHDPDTYARVIAERSFLRTLEGGCQIPIGSHAIITDKQTLSLFGFIGSLNGQKFVREKLEGPLSEAENLGKTLATTMLGKGGLEILEEVRKANS